MRGRTKGLIGLILAAVVTVALIIALVGQSAPLTASEKAILTGADVLALFEEDYQSQSASQTRWYTYPEAADETMNQISLFGTNGTAFVWITLTHFNSSSLADARYDSVKQNLSERNLSVSHPLSSMDGIWYTWIDDNYYNDTIYCACLPADNFLIQFRIGWHQDTVDINAIDVIAQAQYDKILSLSENQ